MYFSPSILCLLVAAVCCAEAHQMWMDDATKLTTFSTALKGISLCPCETCMGGICTNCTGTFKSTSGCHDTERYEVQLYTFLPNSPGVLRLMWFTGDLLWQGFGNATVRVYVDDEVAPSIAFKLYESHALGFGWSQGEEKTWGIQRFGKGSLFGGLFLGFQIPFEDQLRVTIQLSPSDIQAGEKHGFYFIARGILGASVSIGGNIKLPPLSRLKLIRTELVAQPHTTLSIGVVPSGGALFAVTMLASSGTPHFLEGEFRAVLDGTPMTLSSGTEDYFLSAQYFDAGAFQFPVSGCNHVSLACLDSLGECRVAAYRFHETDPIIFQHNMTLTWDVGDPSWLVYNTSVIFYAWIYHW